MGTEKPRLVLDTNVLVSALGWEGPERRLYRACLSGALHLCSSMPLLDELIRVMSYPKLGFSVQDQQAMIQDILRIGYFPSDLPAVQVIREDPADDRVLACALACGADWIVTGDDHLLRLETFRGIPILRAAVLLQQLEQAREQEDG